jgi:hypothetical protein
MPGSGLQALDDAGEERILLFLRAGIADGQLDQHEIIRAGDAHVAATEDQLLGIMLGKHHETVILGHIETLAQGLVDVLEDGGTVGAGLPRSRDTRTRGMMFSLKW